MWNNGGYNPSKNSQRIIDHKDEIIREQASLIDALKQEIQAKQIHIGRLEEQVCLI